jgi:catechol 2,3-dioxygenase-like lactoylglutathione lyase family enzyme
LIVERADFVSVPVKDLEQSAKFYEETLGLERIPGEGSFPEFQLGENVSLYLVDPRNVEAEFTAPHTSPIALRVADVEEARRELEARGVEFAADTFDTGVCHMAIFNDPDGNTFMLHRRYAPPA